MNRVATGFVGLLACAAALVGCSGDKSEPEPAPAPAPTTVAAGGAEVATGGATEIKVEGADLAGVDPASVTCVKGGGKITIGSGAAGPGQALGVVMTDEATPVVESVALMVDGNALGVANTMGVKTGSAEVKADGGTYTITGEAQGADMKNPMAGMVTKKFEIKVSCS